MTATGDATVDADGTVSAYETELEMSGTGFDAIQCTAAGEGDDSVEASLTDGVTENRMENLTYEQTFDGDTASVQMQFVGWNPGPDSDVNTTVENETAVWENGPTNPSRTPSVSRARPRVRRSAPVSALSPPSSPGGRRRVRAKSFC
ncbi:hypothetical protein [Haloarcula marina]|uniref:hypothetical protein n=1 Tax=Haloarcula marina TaxID=2961574 RepID=UPI0020B7779A|nr:hypothetical protein [Halomicroarcula marina]